MKKESYCNRTRKIRLVNYGVKNVPLPRSTSNVEYRSFARLRRSDNVALSGLGVAIFRILGLPLLVDKKNNGTIRNDGG